MSDDTEPLITIQIRLPRSLIRRIDDYRLQTSLRPPRSQMIRFLVERAMSTLEGKDPDNGG